MRRHFLGFLVLGASFLASSLTGVWAAPADAPDGPLSWPRDFALPFHSQPSGEDDKHSGRVNPGVTAPLVTPPKPEAAAPAAPPDAAAELDDLFGRLAKASDATEAGSIALVIEHVWLHSGSDTADLLMVRAVTALGKGNSDLAAQLLDKIVVLDPTWAEAWNRRATLRFLKGDDFGAMDDIAHVLAIEPRHFGALSGMSFILQRHGMKKEALALLRKTDAIYPHNTELEKLTGDLATDVEGREI